MSKRTKWEDDSLEIARSLETYMEVDSFLYSLDNVRRTLEGQRVHIRDRAAESEQKEEKVEQLIDRIAKGKSEWVQDDFYGCACPTETRGNVTFRPKFASVSVLRKLGDKMLCEGCINCPDQFKRVIEDISLRLKQSIVEEQIARAKDRGQWEIDPRSDSKCRMSNRKDHHTTIFRLRVSPALRKTRCTLCKECFASATFEEYVNSRMLSNDIVYC